MWILLTALSLGWSDLWPALVVSLDSRQVAGRVEHAHGTHDSVSYTYIVNGNQLRGSDTTLGIDNRDDLGPGSKVLVSYSNSHPSISLLGDARKARRKEIQSGIPILVVLGALSLLITVITSMSFKSSSRAVRKADPPPRSDE